MKRNTILVNLYSGPGVGKSSMMAGIFSELKFRGVNCEMAPEFAKEKVWEESTKILGNQIYVFGKQLHTIHRLWGKVNVIITDSPLLLSVIYGEQEGLAFRNLVFDVYNRYPSINIMLRRSHTYDPSGRLQTEGEAIKIDKSIEWLLKTNSIPFESYDSGRKSIQTLADRIEGAIK